MEYPHQRFIRYFLKYGDIYLGSVNTLIGNACSVGCVHLLFQHGFTVPEDDEWPMSIACSKGHLDVVRRLIQAGVGIHTEQEEALVSAVDECQYHLVKLFTIKIC